MFNIQSNIKGYSGIALTRPRNGLACSHCDRVTGTFASGFARDNDGKPLCHPNVTSRPDCYTLVMVHGHQKPCINKECFEDNEKPEDLKKYLPKPKTTRKRKTK